MIIRKTNWCENNESLEGKTIIVTGGSFGVGRSLAVELARRGARVVVPCRTKARRDSTAFFLRKRTGSFNLRVMFMDLNSLDTVWEFAKEFVDTEDRLDAIINNAAVLCDTRDWTADGFDAMMGVNYVGHFLLTILLLDKLSKCPDGPARVINVVCGSCKKGNLANLLNLEGQRDGSYSFRHHYHNSKLAQYIFTKELSRRFRSVGIVAFAVNPGLVSSGLYKLLTGISGQLIQICAKVLYRTPEEGIQTILHCLLAKGIEPNSGALFRDCRMQDINIPKWDDQVAKELWENTRRLIKQKGIPVTLKENDDEE